MNSMLRALVPDVFTDEVERCVVSDTVVTAACAGTLRRICWSASRPKDHHDVFAHYQVQVEPPVGSGRCR